MTERAGAGKNLEEPQASPAWSLEERNIARILFTEHNRANGALLPDGFGFLRPSDQLPWLQLAREKLDKARAAVQANGVSGSP